MGLTIHYDLEFSGTDTEVQNKLKEIKFCAEQLPFAEINGPAVLDYEKWTIEKKHAKKGYNDWRDWASIQGMNYEKGDANGPKAYCLNLFPGEGCEDMNIGLRQHKNSNLWTWDSFCKTQYAEEFVKCHLLVIRMLDECKRLGILKDVRDDGEYWETRDVRVLGGNINESTEMLQDISKKLSKTGFRIKAPITERANKMTRLEIEFAEKNKQILPVNGNN